MFVYTSTSCITYIFGRHNKPENVGAALGVGGAHTTYTDPLTNGLREMIWLRCCDVFVVVLTRILWVSDSPPFLRYHGGGGKQENRLVARKEAHNHESIYMFIYLCSGSARVRVSGR